MKTQHQKAVDSLNKELSSEAKTLYQSELEKQLAIHDNSIPPYVLFVALLLIMGMGAIAVIGGLIINIHWR